MGFVSGAYVAAELFDVVGQQLPRDTQLAITDAGAVVKAGPDVDEGGVTRQLSVGGRTWTLTVGVPGEPDYAIPLVLLAISLMLTAVVQLAITLARRRERSLEASGRRFRVEAFHAEALGSLSQAMMEADDLLGVIDAIDRSCVETFGASSVRVGLLERDGSTLEIHRSKPQEGAVLVTQPERLAIGSDASDRTEHPWPSHGDRS